MSNGFWKGFFSMWKDEGVAYRPLIGNSVESAQNRAHVMDYLRNSSDVDRAEQDLLDMGYRAVELHPYVSAVA